MHYPFARRAFAALFAPWFAIVVTEPVPMHDCPVHSIHAVHAEHSASAHGMEMDKMPAAEHDGMAMGDASLPAQSSPHSHHQCCCLDRCSAAVVAHVSKAPQLEWIPFEIRRAIARPDAAIPAPTSAGHVLPFATAPPAASA